MSTRTLAIVALLITVVVGVQARFLIHLPGDPAIATVVQSLSPDRAWVPPVVATASAPLKYILMAIAVLGAWRLAGTRAAMVVIAAIVLEQTFGEASKPLFGRPRPTQAAAAMMAGTPMPAGAAGGQSFPSTFMTIYSVTIGALVVLAWRLRPSGLRTGVIAAGTIVLVLAACARIVPGAHWPSDTVGTVAICLSWLAVAFSAVGAPAR